VPSPPELEPVTDPEFVMSSIGDLIELGNSPDPEGIRVRGLVPGQFEAYVRILHPAWADESRERHVTWAEIAAASGARLDGTVSFRRITVSPGSDIPLGPQGAWDEDATPLTGTLPEKETNALLNLFTPSAVCWFVLWEGWDGLRLDPQQVSVLWHGNPHLVYRGPIELIRRFEWSRRWQIPHLWFADDRTWCVGSDIEAYDTYVGGSVYLVERIVAAPELEALRVHPEDLAIVLGEWGIGR
jgi:hypothetical protein